MGRRIGDLSGMLEAEAVNAATHRAEEGRAMAETRLRRNETVQELFLSNVPR